MVEFYEKRGNCENYIKEAKYDMAVGRLLLQSFWAKEAIFQLMMLAYNADGYIRLFLLFKMDFAGEAEYRQHIKTFRLKYIFLAGKIIRTARSVVMKLDARICESGSPKMMHNGGNDAKLKKRLSKSSPFEVKMLVEFLRR